MCLHFCIHLFCAASCVINDDDDDDDDDDIRLYFFSRRCMWNSFSQEAFENRLSVFIISFLPPRNTSAISRLRSSTPVHRPTSPTKSLNHCYSQNPVLCVSLNPRFIVSAVSSLLLCSTGELTPLSVDG